MKFQLKKAIRELIETFLFGVIVLLVLFTSIQNYQVEGSSMYPTIKEGSCVIANKVSFWKINLTQLPEYIIPQNMKNKQYYYIFSAPKTGDIVVFKYPDDISRSFVKRVVGINGDRVQIINGKLILNDTIINESYLNQKNISRENWGPGIIGPNQYFVLGDNRTASNDSREWGTISDQHVIGKYLFDYGSRLCKISPANR